MTDEAKLEEKLWKALKSDRTVMLGLAGDEAHSQPMTVQFDGEAQRGPLYIFTSKETDLARALGARSEASIQFASKGHDLFAALDGALSVHDDRATIDRLWSPFVAAWFKGKDDPKLLLLRFDPEHAQIWLNENSTFAGIKLLLGSDPKKDYKDKSAEVRLS
jgi:general stress protein 26